MNTTNTMTAPTHVQCLLQIESESDRTIDSATGLPRPTVGSKQGVFNCP